MKTCPKCNTPAEPGHLFCTECGYRFEDGQTAETASDVPAEEPAAAADLDKVENHIMWNIQPGQVARLITEKEFSQYSDAAGLIVSEGSRVLIRRNAEEYTMMSSGVYTFRRETAQTGDGTRPGGFLRNLRNLDRQAANEDANPEFMSILLVRDGDFPVIFGGAGSTGDNFVPMTIPARNLDLEVGVSAMLRIGSMQVFASKWMTDRTRLSTSELCGMISSKVEKTLRDVLADVYVSENGIPETARKEIEDRLIGLSRELGGVTVSSIGEIRTGNEALERFRALNSELYLTEKELEYLERTNQFKNRLAAVQNAQQVEEARNDLQLMRALQQINQDKILAEDELEKFYMVLSREKKIREAQNEEQIAAALADIERTGLVREEDLNRLKDQIRSDEHRRGHAFRMMQKRDELELETLQREFDRRIREEDYEFEKRKKDDEFGRFKELEQIRREKEAEEHNRNMEALREMQRAKLEKLRLSKELTPEQLMAIAANENLSSEAAAAFAESLGKGRDAEAERRHQEDMERLVQARIDDMKDMSRTEHETVRELIRSMAPNQNPAGQPAAGASGFRFCPQCGNKCEASAKFCMNCGNPLN
ncbi:MAG: zinc-ribbon domain-containing protein [Candidatus Cryptobacteroides sp.]